MSGPFLLGVITMSDPISMPRPALEPLAFPLEFEFALGLFLDLTFSILANMELIGDPFSLPVVP